MVDKLCECRYIRSLPVNQNFHLPAFNIQKMQPPYYEMGFTGYNQIPNAPAPLNFGPPTSSILSPYGTAVLHQPSRDAMYMQWPNAAMMYAHSYEQFRNASLQVYSIWLFFPLLNSLWNCGHRMKTCISNWKNHGHIKNLYPKYLVFIVYLCIARLKEQVKLLGLVPCFQWFIFSCLKAAVTCFSRHSSLNNPWASTTCRTARYLSLGINPCVNCYLCLPAFSKT